MQPGAAAARRGRISSCLQARVTSLQISPKDDCFASAAADGTACFWDLRTVACQGVLRLGAVSSHPAVAFDPQGLVFTAAAGDGTILLFDARKYDGGPFDTFAAPFESPKDVSTLKFSRDGKSMLLATTQGEILILDAFMGGVRRQGRAGSIRPRASVSGSARQHPSHPPTPPPLWAARLWVAEHRSLEGGGSASLSLCEMWTVCAAVQVLGRFSGHSNVTNAVLEAEFSPDGEQVRARMCLEAPARVCG